MCRQPGRSCRITTACATGTGGDLHGTRYILLGVLAVAAAASTWGTLGLFSKMLYAQGVSFEALVAFRASVGWLAVMVFLLATGGARSLSVPLRDLAFLVPLGLVGIGSSTSSTSSRSGRALWVRRRSCSTARRRSWCCSPGLFLTKRSARPSWSRSVSPPAGSSWSPGPTTRLIWRSPRRCSRPACSPGSPTACTRSSAAPWPGD